MRIALDIPPGIVGDDTSYAEEGRWGDGSNVRFRLGHPQTIGGFESLTTTLLTGVCRLAFPWTDNSAIQNIAFGTHEKVQLWQGGTVVDITPFGPVSLLGSAPFAVTNGSGTITVTHTAHGLATNDTIKVQGSDDVGRLSLDGGPYTITKVNADSYTFPAGSNATVSKTLANNPLTTLNGTPTVTVSEPSHTIEDGTTVTFSGAAAVGGITPNGSFSITVIDANRYSYTFTSNATSTATGGGAAVVAAVPTTGGGSNVHIIPQSALPTGVVDGSGSVGYGTGGYGDGEYGISSDTDSFFPTTWSFGAWGQQLLASPRNGGLYLWQNVTATRAAAVDNAPTKITYMLVAPMNGGFQAFALGTQQEADGVFNPSCIRHSSVRDNTQWSTTASGSTAREYILTGGGRIVAGRMAGPYMLVWTADALFLGTFVGELNEPWRFDRVGKNCGLIGPNAAVVVGQTAFWISPDRQFYSYSVGGEPTVLPCPLLTEFSENLASAQGDKIVASSNSMFSEIRFDYPDTRDGFENSRYLSLCVTGPDAGSWHKGIMARTAFVDSGPTPYPIGVTVDGNVYYHDKGSSADGSSLSWFIETADQNLNPDTRMLVRGLWLDFKDQAGPVTVSVSTKETPEGDDTVTTASASAPTDVRADLMTSGRFFKVKFAGDSSPTYCRIGRPIFDAVPAGLL